MSQLYAIGIPGSLATFVVLSADDAELNRKSGKSLVAVSEVPAASHSISKDGASIAPTK